MDSADRAKDSVVVRESLEDGQMMKLTVKMPHKPSIKVVRMFKRLKRKETPCSLLLNEQKQYCIVIEFFIL